MSPVIMQMDNNDYNLIMKCLFHNISFDDGCEPFHIFNYKSPEQQLQEKLEIQKALEEESHKVR